MRLLGFHSGASSPITVAADDLHELHDHLPVGLQGGYYDVLVGAVVAAADGAELHARYPGPLKVDDVARTVAADADGVAAEVARRDLTQGLHVGVAAGGVRGGWGGGDTYLGRGGHRPA